MSELHALLRACKADPDDDAPRLILADWLEEHGQSERAAVVRTQVANRQHLLRERDVPREWFGEWAGWRDSLSASPDPWENSRVEFWLIRGLVHLSGDEDLPRRLGPMLRPEADWSWIEDIACALWCSQCDLSPLLNSAQVHHVTGLAFDGDQSGPDIPRQFADCQPLPHLTDLSISCFGRTDRDAAVLSECETFPGLRVLSLWWNVIGPDGAATIAASPTWDGLVRLALGANPLGDAGVEAIAFGRPRPRLRRLDLGGCDCTDDGAFALAASDRFPHLEELRFWSNKVGPVGVEALMESPYLKGTKVLLGINEGERPSWVDEFREKYGDRL
jgi:uncharacterized protein (TIGR02996 family)